MKTLPCVVILGRIVTMSDDAPAVEGICACGGRVLCMGSRSEVLEFASRGEYTLIDMTGHRLYPGFIDTHSHLSGYSDMIDQVFCGTSNGSIANILKALGKAAATGTDKWVVGYGYDDSGMPENRHLTIGELDSICPDKPLLVRHISVHSAYVNSAALRELGYDASTKREGGEIVLDAEGHPTGHITEQLAFEAFAKLPAPSPDQTKENIARAIAEYNSKGFTAFMDGGMGIFGDASTLVNGYCALDREKRLHARAWLQAIAPVMKEWKRWGIYGGIGSDHLRFGGFKTFTDGSIQCFTAALREDYHTRPGWKGDFITSQEEIEEAVCACNAAGIQAAVHCNGDAGIDLALGAFEKAWSESPRPDLAHMIVHAQTASDEQLARMKACGVIPTLFANHVEVWGDRHRDIFLGPDRAARLDPAGSCVRLGMPFGLHVDTPVLPPSALGSMHNAVNRITSGGILLGEDQRISPLDALKAYTVHASRCWHGEGEVGVIKPGAFADLVCLDADLETVDPARIRDVKVLATICGGEIVYDAR